MMTGTARQTSLESNVCDYPILFVFDIVGEVRYSCIGELAVE